MGSEGGGGKPQRAQGLQIWYEGEEMKLAKLVFRETGIESLWARYSAGRRSGKMAGLHPNMRLTFPFTPAFLQGEKCRQGIWNSGKRLIGQKPQSGRLPDTLSSAGW